MDGKCARYTYERKVAAARAVVEGRTANVFCRDDLSRGGWYRFSVPFSLGCKG